MPVLLAAGGIVAVALLGLAATPSQSAPATPDWVRRVIERVSASEGRPDSLNRNLDGNGLSFGVIQWTQRSANLGVLLAAMYQADPAAFAQVFGQSWATMLEVARRGSLEPVDRASLWEEPWASRFAAAGRYAPFVDVQWRLAAEGEHFRGALGVATLLGVCTERAMALFFDRSVHQGPKAAIRMAEQLRDFYVRSGAVSVGYRELLEAYAWLAASRFRRTTPPESEQYSAQAPHVVWKQVGEGWHAFAGAWDLYGTVSLRSGWILKDPELSDSPLVGVVPSVAP